MCEMLYLTSLLVVLHVAGTHNIKLLSDNNNCSPATVVVPCCNHRTELFGKFSNAGVWLFVEQEEEKTWRDVFVAQKDIKMAAMCVYCSQLATQTVFETEICINN